MISQCPVPWTRAARRPGSSAEERTPVAASSCPASDAVPTGSKRPAHAQRGRREDVLALPSQTERDFEGARGQFLRRVHVARSPSTAEHCCLGERRLLYYRPHGVFCTSQRWGFRPHVRGDTLDPSRSTPVATAGPSNQTTTTSGSMCWWRMLTSRTGNRPA